jgi:tetratricopeptide (TPR) repeat protein
MTTGNQPADVQGTSASRTQWDAIVEIIKLFGKGAPYVVILAGAIYTVWQFQTINDSHTKSLNDARDAAAKLSQEWTKIANDAVLKSSTTIAELVKAQVQILQQTDEFQVKSTGRILKTQDDYDQRRKEWQQQQQKLEEQIREEQKVVSEKEGEKKDVERDLASSKSNLATLNDELTQLAKTRDVTISTLATVGTLVDDAPELLRAVATTDGVRSILSQSTALLQKAILPPRLQYRRVQIALAFADLEGFVGDPLKQKELANGGLDLVANLRDSGQLRENGLTDSLIDADEAMARFYLGDALGAQQDFGKSIEETRKSIELYDRALASEDIDRRSRVKWQRRQAEAFGHLGRTIDRYSHDHDVAIRTLQKAVESFQELQDEYPSDLSYAAEIAWARFNLAEVERDHQALEAASRQYQLARDSIDKQEISEYVHRSNEWLDRAARIYNGSALLLLDQVLSSDTGQVFDTTDAVVAQRSECEQKLNEALGYLTKAKIITEQLVQADRSNLAWRTTHGWSLHNLGEIELALGTVTRSSEMLDASIRDFDKALGIRKVLYDQAQGRLDWRMDLRWTQLHLNTAKAKLARRNEDYMNMRDLFAENVTLADEALKDDPASDDWRRLRVDNQASYADAIALLGQETDARKIYTEIRAVAVAQMGMAKQKGERDRWTRLIKRIDRALAGRS